MKKLISIFSMAAASVLIQNCAHRDEDLNVEDFQSSTTDRISIMSKDSAKTSEGNVPPNPPVRDGDNWRSASNK